MLVPFSVPPSVPRPSVTPVSLSYLRGMRGKSNLWSVPHLLPSLRKTRGGSGGTTRCLYIKHRSSVPRCNPCEGSHFMGDG